MAANKAQLDQADYDKAEADAMRVLGTLVRSTKTEPEHRIAAAEVILNHVQDSRDMIDTTVYSEVVEVEMEEEADEQSD